MKHWQLKKEQHRFARYKQKKHLLVQRVNILLHAKRDKPLFWYYSII